MRSERVVCGCFSGSRWSRDRFRTPDNEPLPEGIHTLQQLEKYLSEQYETVVFNSVSRRVAVAASASVAAPCA